MAENITTIQDKNELTLDEIVNDNVANLLYMIHGTGSDRDKKVNFETIKQYFEENCGSLTINNGSITVKLSGAGGTQTLTINHNGIVYTSSFSGSTITKKIDFEGTGSKLSSLTLDTLSGSIPDGNSHKLDIDTNVVVEKDFSAKNVETDSLKINTAIDVNSASFALTSREASVGDIVILHNVYSSDVTVEVHVVRDPTSGWATAKWNTTLKQRSSMMLRCVAIHTINDVKSYEWSPLCNSEVTVNYLM